MGGRRHFEQEETRGIRTHRYARWKRLAGRGPSVLFDLQAHPAQPHDLGGDPAYAEVKADLDEQPE